MRTILFLLTSLLLTVVCTAQEDLDISKGFYRVYFLPDGSAINGRILSRIGADSIAIETQDGQVYKLSKAQAKVRGDLQVLEEASIAAGYRPAPEPQLPMLEQPLFKKGASQISADILTHFSSGGDAQSSTSESGVVFSASYLYGIAPRLKVGAGGGVMTLKSGSKERLFPLFATAEYQLRPRISGGLSGGYSFVPTNDVILEAENGLFSKATVAFDLVGPESAYTSRIGIGLIVQQVDIGRSEVIREQDRRGNQTSYTQYVVRSGVMRRIQITFTHAWRMPTRGGAKRGKSK